ncbi:hypothetical protein ACX0GZ_11800 [Sphingomonas aestuarii]
MKNPSLPNLFDKKLFEIEHALDIFAYSYVHFPAKELYNPELTKLHGEIIKKCHVYLIGYVPIVRLESADQVDGSLVTNFLVGGLSQQLKWKLPPRASLRRDGEEFWVEDDRGNRTFPGVEASIFRLNSENPILFDVQYIGQAYGEDGSRNALDRLTKHETLQRIALTAPPENQRLEVVLIEVQPNTRMMTIFNPWAAERDKDGSRMDAALDSLFNTTEAQQVSLYEAALIRYFQPKYNKTFKNSFPSTNLKILQQCYDKDMAGVIAEFCFDELPFYLRSDSVKERHYHIAAFNIHGREERDVFFGIKSGIINPIVNDG